MMKVVIHASQDDASASVLAGLIASVRPEATIAFDGEGPAAMRDRPSRQPAGFSLDGLSPRESVVVERLGAGQSVGQCADAIGVSSATVKVYAARARRKLALRNEPA